MNKKISIFGTTLLIVFLMGTISSELTTSVATSTPLTKGESFTFTVSQFTETAKINGTAYTLAVNNTFGTNPTMVITNVTNTNVYLNYTVNGTNKTTTSPIDSFMQDCAEFFYSSADNAFSGEPSSTLFAAPSNTSEGVPTLYFLPMFASGNISLYNSEVPNVTLAEEQPGWSSYIINTNIVNSSVSGNMYKVSFNQSLTDARKIQTGSTYTNYSNTHAQYFSSTIDTAKQVVTDFYYQLTVNIKFGLATASAVLIMHIVENQNTSTQTGNNQSTTTTTSSSSTSTSTQPSTTQTKSTAGFGMLVVIAILPTIVMLRKKKRN